MAITLQDLRLAQDALAQDGREARKAIASLERRVSALEGRRTSVAEPTPAVRTVKRGKAKSKRSTPCALHSKRICNRLFWSSVGATDHKAGIR